MTYITMIQYKAGRTGHILKDYMSLILIGKLMGFTIVPPKYTKTDFKNSVDKFDIFHQYKNNRVPDGIEKIILTKIKWTGFSVETILHRLSIYINQNVLIILEGPYRLHMCEVMKKSSLYPHLSDIFNSVLIDFRNNFQRINKTIINKEKNESFKSNKINVVIHCRRGDRFKNIHQNIDEKKTSFKNYISQIKNILNTLNKEYQIIICTEPYNNNDIIEVINEFYYGEIIVRHNKSLIQDIALMSIADIFISCGSSVSVWALYLNPHYKINNKTYHYINYDNKCYDYNAIIKNNKLFFYF